MTTQPDVQNILHEVKQLDDEAKRFLIDQIQAMLQGIEEANPQVADTWSEVEVAALIDPQPMTGQEIIAAGLTGTWADLGIEDGAEWVNAQKAKRRGTNHTVSIIK